MMLHQAKKKSFWSLEITVGWKEITANKQQRKPYKVNVVSIIFFQTSLLWRHRKELWTQGKCYWVVVGQIRCPSPSARAAQSFVCNMLMSACCLHSCSSRSAVRHHLLHVTQTTSDFYQEQWALSAVSTALCFLTQQMLLDWHFWNSVSFSFLCLLYREQKRICSSCPLAG